MDCRLGRVDKPHSSIPTPMPSKAVFAFVYLFFAAAAFLLFQAFFIARLRAFFRAAVIERVFALEAAGAAIAGAAGFAALAFLAAQISRILCAWAFRSAGVLCRPLPLSADGRNGVCRITALVPVPLNSVLIASISASMTAFCRSSSCNANSNILFRSISPLWPPWP